MGVKIGAHLGLSCSSPSLPAVGHQPHLASKSPYPVVVCEGHLPTPSSPARVLGAPIECDEQIPASAQVGSRPSSTMASVSRCTGLSALGTP